MSNNSTAENDATSTETPTIPAGHFIQVAYQNGTIVKGDLAHTYTSGDSAVHLDNVQVIETGGIVVAEALQMSVRLEHSTVVMFSVHDNRESAVGLRYPL